MTISANNITFSIFFPTFQIRLTAFGLLIETSKAHFEFVEPYLTDIMPILGQNLHIDNFPVCCNAMNALDEIIVKLGVQIEPYIPYVLETSVNIINVQDADEPLLYQTGENKKSHLLSDSCYK